MSDHPDLFGHASEESDKWAVLWSAKTDEWPTDWVVVQDWQRRLGVAFNLDVAATAENTKASRFYTAKDDALRQPWAKDAEGGAVWCNPPYSDIDRFVAKALHEATPERPFLLAVGSSRLQFSLDPAVIAAEQQIGRAHV